jgi:hypothetical protein
MRVTMHMVSGCDFVAFRPLLQPLMESRFRSSPFARELDGIDVAAVAAAGRELIEDEPRTRAELSRLLAERWPDRDPLSLAYVVTHIVPVVQVPPRGGWGARGQATWTTGESWLGRSLSGAPTAELVTRYLAAFGPASVMDFQNWSGLTRIGEVVEPMRPGLRTFGDENGVELLDLPDAPLPDPDTPAPVRFVPNYDNVLLGMRIGPASRLPSPARRCSPATPATSAVSSSTASFADSGGSTARRARPPCWSRLQSGFRSDTPQR